MLYLSNELVLIPPSPKISLSSRVRRRRGTSRQFADAEGISVTALKKKLKAERAAKALAEQKDKERQDRKLKNKQEGKDNLRAAAEAEGMSITGYKKQLNGGHWRTRRR